MHATLYAGFANQKVKILTGYHPARVVNVNPCLSVIMNHERHVLVNSYLVELFVVQDLQQLDRFTCRVLKHDDSAAIDLV
ncbi:hypothetical protein ART_1574 [Arthrobacter sp. PAMC 25486]|nr:hypothetical protein ART_1574 [Arthrobacter sp. PAMC 25486]